MIVQDDIDHRPTRVRRRLRRLQFPEKRPSILDVSLESEPAICQCACSETLVLYLHNHPIALICGTALDNASLSMRLYQLRHRWPRVTS